MSLLLYALSAVSLAQADSVSTNFAEAAGWDIQRRPDGCFMMSAYGATESAEGETTFAYFVSPDESQMLIFHNSRWQLAEETGRDFTLLFEGTEGNWQQLVGQARPDEEEGSTISLSFDSSALRSLSEDIGSARGVRLLRGDRQIEGLSLTGAPEALRLLTQCVATLRR